MRLLVLALVGGAVLSAANPFAGRWNLTVKTAAASYPGWLELVDKDGELAVRFQPRGGSVRPVKEAKIEGGKLILPMGPQKMEFTAAGDKLSGTQSRDGVTNAEIAGVRAPKLDRKAPKAWSKPEPIFNGKDLSGWEPFGGAGKNFWVAQDGVLLNREHGMNIRTARKFDDFKLHIEYNCPDKGNSGIYLRGRYEVQVEYEPSEDTFHRMGAVYGMIPVAKELPRKPGEWESFDITLVGRTVTVVRNGVTVIDAQEIAGTTGGAIDSDEAAPGPFYLQGDHTGNMRYRNITVSVPKK